VVAGWAAAMLVWLFIGVRFKTYALELQAGVTAVLVFIRFLTCNLEDGYLGANANRRLEIGSGTVAALFGGYFILPRDYWFAPLRPVFAILGSLLAALLLSKEVTGQQLTVSVAIEGAILLAVGFQQRDRVLRLCGLAGLLFATGKLFAWDIQTFDTPTKIVSFLGLGVLLMAASFVYARFKDKLKELL